MTRKLFSTGLPAFDRFLGGLAAGDAILVVHSDPRALDSLVGPMAAYAAGTRLRIAYLSVGDLLKRHLDGAEGLLTRRFPASEFNPRTLPRAVKRFLARVPGGTYVLMDDLSEWRSILRTDRQLVDLYASVVAAVHRKRSVLVTSVIRSSGRHATLAELKDVSTICIELTASEGQTYCLPLSLRGRYIPHGVLPLRFPPRSFTESETGEVRKEDSLRLSNLFAAADQRYERLFRKAAEAMVLFDVTGNLREPNDEMERLLGRSIEEIKTLDPAALVGARRRISYLRFLAQLRRKGTASITLDLPGKAGRTFPAEFRASRIGASLCFGVLRDQSERASEEEMLRQQGESYRQLVEQMPEAVLVAQNGRIRYANRASAKLFGFQSAEGMQDAVVRKILSQESWRTLQKILREAAADAESRTVTGRCVRTDGTEFDARLATSGMLFDGKPSTQVVVTDVSSEKNAFEVLAAAEQRYRSAVEASPQPVTIVRDGKYVYANQAFCDLFGFGGIDEVLGNDITLLVPETDRDRFGEQVRKRLSGPAPGAPVDVTALTKDGKTLDCRILTARLPSRTAGDLLFCHDRTDVTRTARELELNRSEMELLGEVLPLFERSMDLRKLVQASVNRLMEVLGWGIGAIYLTDRKEGDLRLSYHRNLPAVLVEKLQRLSSSEGIGGYLSKTQESQRYATARYPSYLPFRSLFAGADIRHICFLPLIVRSSLAGIILLASKEEDSVPQASPQLLGIVGRTLGRAIMNAQSYLELGESEGQFRTLAESADAVLYRAAASGAFGYVSSQIENLTGHPPKEYYRNPTLWLGLVHPDDKKILLERTTRLHEFGRHAVLEYRILPKGKAEYRWIRDSASLERDEAGAVVRMYGTLADITVQKVLLDQLRADNSLKSNILASIQEGVIVFDPHLRCLVCNEAVARMLGRTCADLIGQHASDMLPGYEEAGIGKLLGHALDGETDSTDDISYPRGGGNGEGYLWGNFSPLRDEKGQIAGAVGILLDVSQRKLMESEMRESEQVLRNVIDTMGDVLMITDLRGMVLQVNRAFRELLGYTRTEAVSYEFPYPWLLDEEMGRYVLWIANLRERNWLHDFDMTWKAKDGRMIPMSLSTTLLRNSLGEPIAMLNIARDITERKRLAKDLERKNRQFEMINRIISKANQTMDFDEIFGAIAKEINDVVSADAISVCLLKDDRRSIDIHALTGARMYWRGDAVPLEQTLANDVMITQAPIVVPDLSTDPRRKTLLSPVKGLRSEIALPILLKDQIVGTLNIGGREPYLFSEEHIEIFQPIAQQLGATLDRIRLFNQVTADSAYIHNLLDSLDNIVYTVDTQFRIREVNKAWRMFIRESGMEEPRSYYGLSLFDVLPTESLKSAYRRVADGLIDGSIKVFSEEYEHTAPGGERIYQLAVRPLVIEKRVTGLVFTQTDITMLKRTEAELKKSNEQLLALNEISTLISTSLELQETLGAAIPLLRRTIGAGAVIVYLREEGSDDLVSVYQLGFEDAMVDSIRRLRGSASATGEAVSTKQAIYMRDRAHEDERIIPQNRPIMRRLNLQAMAAIPLVSKDNVLGALDIFYDGPHEFTALERQILILVGNQLGAAAENSQLYGELRAQVERLTVLYELSRRLTSTLDTGQIFQLVDDHIRHILPLEKFAVDVFDPAKKTRTRAFATGEGGGAEIRNGPSRISPDTPEGIAFSSKRTVESPDRRSIYLPMLSKDAILGIMTITAAPGTPYSDAQLKLLESIASLTAIALEKGKLYEETVQKSMEIERRNKELDEFTYVVSHDLKEPLISVEGFSKILQADYGGIIQPEGKEYLDSIVGASTRMKGLIDDLLLLSRVGRPSESFSMVSVSDLLNEIMIDMEFIIRQRGIRVLIPDDLPSVFGNRTQLQIVFRNLVSNAVKFNDKEHPVIEIGFQNAENNQYLFSVKDNGIGIEKDFHEKIFVIFQRLHRREEYEGSGAGLAIVKKIIELHQGKIWVESEPGKGATFYFTIPRPTPPTT